MGTICTWSGLLPLVVTFALIVTVEGASDWGDLRLPLEHVPYFFRNNPHLEQRCKDDDTCPYKSSLEKKRCWGYEDRCPAGERMSTPLCTDDENSRRGQPSVVERNIDMFWKQADFGYVKERRDNLRTYCNPQSQGDSSLECVDGLKYCRATNIYIDLRTAGVADQGKSYRQDVLTSGQLGGHCRLNKAGLLAQKDNTGFLSSWYHEIEHFTSLTSRPLKSGKCDVIIDKPTFIIKLDAGGNMFHHFCDFVNLYISQHLNNSFSTDVNIFVWDTSRKYMELFQETWHAFTDHPRLMLVDLEGKRVCFKDAIFSFLARMTQGLFYALRPVNNCYNSGLMRAFSQHILHRLGIRQHGPLVRKVRVTFMSRNTRYRKIRNIDKLESALNSHPDLDVKVVDYNRHIPFPKQLEISHNTDILIGIHGAGLTHMLFLPDWAVVFEIYNCEDAPCYLNLARLRGIKYMTWENMDKLKTIKVDDAYKGGAMAKFVDYEFDPHETLRLVRRAADHVTSHHAFVSAGEENSKHIHKEEL
ncbi:EGF domain-specific O-linked N-acetylglucosamine transferase-like isoform X1 [Haliotis asinina]|uniref:EGF domain-specific O-linked N-acetylglucosamine transferase-like isoform X1 n=1 Tax=Haliotis asinina TaxID=109174 RepID=UPI003532317A